MNQEPWRRATGNDSLISAMRDYLKGSHEIFQEAIRIIENQERDIGEKLNKFSRDDGILNIDFLDIRKASKMYGGVGGTFNNPFQFALMILKLRGAEAQGNARIYHENIG